MPVREILWDDDKLKDLPQKSGFRLRGLEMTRLETFSDAAFAFATTLLVISVGSIPQNFGDLVLALKGIPAFAASFTSIAFLWIAHRKWSRRYGLEDMLSTLISLGLIFIMLVYVYPLKMIFSAFFAWVSAGWLPTSFSLNNQLELIYLFVIYGLGFAAVMLMYTLLYQRALALKDQLQLNTIEEIRTRSDVVFTFTIAITAFASALFAIVLPGFIAVFAGFVYWTLPFSLSLVRRHFEKKVEKLQGK